MTKFDELYESIVEAKVDDTIKYHFQLIDNAKDTTENLKLTLADAAKMMKEVGKLQQVLPADARLIKAFKTNVKAIKYIEQNY